MFFRKILHHLIHSTEQFFAGAVVAEHLVGTGDADGKVLLVGVCGRHFAPLVRQKRLVCDMVGLGVAQHGPLVTDFRIRIHRPQLEIAFGLQGVDFAGRADAFNHRVVGLLRRTLVQTVSNVRRRVGRTQLFLNLFTYNLITSAFLGHIEVSISTA